MHVYVYKYMYISNTCLYDICIYMCVYIHIYIDRYLYIYIYIYIYVYICIYKIYVYMIYVYTCVCVYIHIYILYIYIYIHLSDAAFLLLSVVTNLISLCFLTFSTVFPKTELLIWKNLPQNHFLLLFLI